jgi:hypothetical protein
VTPPLEEEELLPPLEELPFEPDVASTSEPELASSPPSVESVTRSSLDTGAGPPTLPP